MMHRKAGWVVAVMVAMGAASLAQAASSPLTLLAVPARYSVMQVAFDVLRHREAVLVTYQKDAQTDQTVLHAWNGREWVFVSMDDYRQAKFVQERPARVVLIGEEGEVPPVLAEASSWCPVVLNATALDTASLVNAFGRIFSFKRAEWRWFTKRYNMELVDLNSERRQTSWYDGKTVEEPPPPMLRKWIKDPSPQPEPAPVVPMDAPPEGVKAVEPAPSFPSTEPAAPEATTEPAAPAAPAMPEAPAAPVAPEAVATPDAPAAPAPAAVPPPEKEEGIK